MPTQSQEPAQLYAAYIELVNEDGPNRRRKQWIVLPQLPARLAPGDSPIVGHMTWFERAQRNASHRAVWQFHADVSGQFKENLASTVLLHQDTGWVASPMITCEIHPTELAQVLRDRRTPYRIMARLQKVARSMYRLDIS
jgi:hypothetical protein